MKKVSYIKALIAEGEHRQQDFKFGITDSRKIARSLVAFANTDGGRLLIGVKDNGIIAGVRSEEEYYMIESAAHLYSRPEIPFQSKVWKEEGKTVLEVWVPPSPLRPHFSREEADRWQAWVRIHDENVQADEVMVAVWQKQKQKRGALIRYTRIEEELFVYLRSQGRITLSGLCRLARISHAQATDTLATLVVLGLIRQHPAAPESWFEISGD